MGKYTHAHMFLRRHHEISEDGWRFRKKKAHVDRWLERRFTAHDNVWGQHQTSLQDLRRSGKKKSFLALILLGLSLSLTGCMGIYEGGFECPPGEGTKCKSISDVNELVNKGEIPRSENKSQDSDVRESNESGCSCHFDKIPQSKTSEPPQIWWPPYD